MSYERSSQHPHDQGCILHSLVIHSLLCMTTEPFLKDYHVSLTVTGLVTTAVDRTQPGPEEYRGR